MKNNRYLLRTRRRLHDIWFVFSNELRRIFTDNGVILIFFVAGLLYPIVYNLIYWNDAIYDVPVAVVDDSHSSLSRRFVHEVNATPDVKVASMCINMAEAEQLFREQKVRGILYFPADFATRVAAVDGQAHLSLYCDMSSFLYYKNIYTTVNKVMLDEMHNVQIDRYNALGLVGEQGEQLVQAIPYEEVSLFCPTGGYPSFLVPAILILILHQTLFFGIGMLAGTAREENKQLFYLPGRKHERSISRIILGRALAYFVIYMALGTYVLLLIPRMFGLPHVGHVADIFQFMVPFLAATIFFSMTVSVFVRNRETGMVTMLPFTLILLFISGFSWPQASMSQFWRYLSYLFPSTFGIHGFLHINSMGATIAGTQFEYIGLWIQTAVYFATACLSLWIVGQKYERLNSESEQEALEAPPAIN